MEVRLNLARRFAAGGAFPGNNSAIFDDIFDTKFSTRVCVRRARGQTIAAAAAGGAIFGDFRRFIWGPVVQIFVWGPGIVK